MKLKELYTYSNKRQLWRLLPTNSVKIVIEDRDVESKEVFFNCLNIETGKPIISNLQFEEKFWIGIETIHKDIIYLHKFAKPDMPGHKGIIAYDINNKEILWSNDQYTFLFINDGKIYCYSEKFEGKNFYTIDSGTGEFIEDLGDDAREINLIRQQTFNNDQYKNYLFPETFSGIEQKDAKFFKYLEEIKNNKVITGGINFVIKKELLMFNYHEIKGNGKLKNIFTAVDIFTEKSILNTVLNKDSENIIPDSFFVLSDLIFLLKEKNELVVCSIKE